MKNKIIASTLGLMFLAPFAASAYSVPTPDFSAANVPDPSSFESHYDWATSLTEAQRESVKEMKKNMRTKIKADLKDATDTEKTEIKEALKLARQAMKEKRKAEFESLSDEQKEELKELRGGEHGKRFGKRGSFKHFGQRMTAEEKAEFEALSDEEKDAKKAEMKLERESKRAEFEAMTDEEKTAHRAERKAEFEAMTDEEKAEHRAEMKEKRGDRHGKKRGFMKKMFGGDDSDNIDHEKFENLSEVQQAEIKELKKSFMEKMKAYFK